MAGPAYGHVSAQITAYDCSRCIKALTIVAFPPLKLRPRVVSLSLPNRGLHSLVSRWHLSCEDGLAVSSLLLRAIRL